jgi:hypothetical protein
MKVQICGFFLIPVFCLILPGVGWTQTQEADQPRKPEGDGGGVRPWTASFGVHQSYEGDAQITEQEGGAISRGFTGRVGRTWLLRRGTVLANGDATQLMYSGGGTNQLMYGVNGATSYLLTPRVTWSAGGSLNQSYAKDSTVLVEAGTILGGALTKTVIASNEVAFALSPRSTFNAFVSFTRVSFDAEQFTSGSSLLTRASFSRELTRTQSLEISVGNTFSSGLTGDIQGLLASWRRRVGSGLTVSLGGGVRPYSLYGESGYRIAPGLSAGVTGRLSPTQTLSVTYERAVEQAYGFDRTHLAHRFNGNHELAIGRRFQLSNTLNYGLNSYPQIKDYLLGGWTYVVGARCLLVRNLALTGNYSYWLVQETGVPSTSTWRTDVGIAYGFGWR